jgi:DNA polymerase elongation subunit (family B)
MIVEQVGRNDVLVRYRDENGKRQQTKITDRLPYCFVRDEDAEYIHGEMKETGYIGVFGKPLTKISCYTTDAVRALAKTGDTWEGNIPFTNQVLTARKKAGEKTFEPYHHRVWFLDGEWKTDSGQITMLTVYDNFTENLYSWAVLPNGVAKGKYTTLLDANDNQYTYDTPVLVFDTEAELLTHFTAFMRKQDPDIITGWYVAGADLKQIIERCNKVGVRASTMSPLNRIRYDFGDWAQPIVGRNVIDLRIAFPKLWELKNGKLPNYKLDDVAWECLGEKKTELPDGHDTYYSDPILYLEYNRQDVRLLPRLNGLVNALDYFIAVQHIAQCEIRSTPHITKVFTCLALGDPEFKRQIPSKPMFDKVEYDGAIVMDGEKGIYQNIGIFDVKAMYHSNAALHNISWDTLDKNGKDCGNGTGFSQEKKGLLVRQMDNMTVLRDHYKQLMKDASTDEERVRYDALQYATKSLVASMYGVAGDSKYGLYHPEIAAAITFTSRQTLLKLKEVAEDLGHPVVYGHTDSVMCKVRTPDEGEMSLGEMNRRMHPIIVQFEKWSSSFIYMGKNRYAGLVCWTDGEHHNPKRYVKGIELKQNRMPPVMKNAMGKVIDGILGGYAEVQITDPLVKTIENIIEAKIDPLDLCMKAKLTKNLNEYTTVGGMAAGAQWANRTLGKGYRGGDYFLVTIDPQGQYIAFDDPSEIEGIAEIGYRVMVDRFIIKKVLPYYEVVGWDVSPLYRAMDGKSQVAWL